MAEPPPSRASDIDERDFLLGSLDDLDREHAAGDIDDADYRALRDDYTARAAAALRRIDGGPAEASDPPSASPSARIGAPGGGRRGGLRQVTTWGVVALLAVGGGIAVARAAGERVPGGSLTGTVRNVSGSSVVLPDGCPSDIRAPKQPKPRVRLPRQTEVDALVDEGRQKLGNDLLGSLKAFDRAVEIDPDNVVGLTYGGWVRRIAVTSGAPPEFLDRAQTLLDRAISVDPTFADARAFRGVVLLRDRGNAESAVRDFCVLALLDPPPEVRQLAAQAFTDALRLATS